MENNIRSQTIYGAKWAAIEKFSLQLIQFILGIILARILTPNDYGIIGMLTVFIAISNVFIDSGFSSALIRKLDNTEKDYSTAFITNMIISLFFVILLYVSAPWIADFYKMPIISPVLRVQSISLILYALMAVQTTKLTADLNFKALAKASIISAPLSGLFGIGLAYCGFGVWALVFQNLLSITFRFVCIVYMCRWFPKTCFSKKSFDELFGFGKNMLGAGLLTAIYYNIDSIVIGRFFTPAALGNYSRGIQIAKLPVDNINGVLNTVTYPILAKLQNDVERLISAYRKYIKIASMCIFFCCMLMTAMGKPLVLFLLSEKWADAIIYLQIYSFAIMLDHLSVINLNLIKIKGRSDLVLRLEIIKRIISFTILVIAIPFGVKGICISKCIYSVLAVCINTYYNGKLFSLGIVVQFKDYFFYLICSVVACLPAFALSYCSLPYIIILILGTVASLFLYYYMLRKDDSLIEVLSIVKSKIK